MVKLTINGTEKRISYWTKDTKIIQRIKKRLVDRTKGVSSMTDEEIFKDASRNLDEEMRIKELQGGFPIPKMWKTTPEPVIKSLINDDMFEFIKICNEHGIGKDRHVSKEEMAYV